MVCYGVVVGVLPTARVWAQQANSTNYQVDEVYFGSGGELHACSATYCAKQAAGETAVGNPASANYQARAGFDTNREETLELTVNSSTTNFGVISSSTPSTTSGTFSVKSYLTNGYIVVNGSDPPSSNGNFITNLTSQTASSAGTEQFGINLKANTSPATVGADPVQSPVGFGYGAAATGYDTTNVYKYVKGDTIASATKSSGTTQYTVTYLINISNATKAGHYTFNHVIVATSTF
jgi:hypothetical protein